VKLSLGQAARTAGMSKSTLQRMLQRGHIAGTQRPDSVWEIDMSEVQRLIDSRDAPQRGKRVPAPVEAPAPPVEARPEAVELAAVKAELQGVRDRLADMIARAEAAEAREAAERERVDRLTRLIEDKRPTKGVWARLFRG